MNSRADKSPVRHNPITTAPLASTYKKLDRATPKPTGGYAAAVCESSPDEAEYSQEMNEVLEKALQNSISRFNTSLKKKSGNAKSNIKSTTKKNLSIISTISENQQKNPAREASPTIDESTFDRDLASRTLNSPYGASVELPKIHRQPPVVRQKMTRNKSLEGSKGKSINYGEMFSQVKRTNQEIEGNRYRLGLI